MDNTTNTAGEALDLNKTRAEFEAWAEGYFMCFVLHKAGEGYASTMTQAAWEAWCAALARAGSAAPAGQQAEPVAIYQTRPKVPNGMAWEDVDQRAYDTASSMPNFEARIVYAAPLPTKEGAGEVDAKDAALLRAVVEKGIQLHFEGRGEDDAVWVNDLMRWSDGDRLGATRALIEQEVKNLAAIAAHPKDTTDTKEKN